jgi:hypothetical protein
MMARPKYLYQAATIGGIFQSCPSNMRHARAVVTAHQSNWPGIEIERVLEVGYNAHRYWRWRSGRWTTDITSDPEPEDLRRWDRMATAATVRLSKFR